MTFWQEIWSDVREFYRPILPWFLAGFGLLLASIPAKHIHPWLEDVLGYCGVGCIGIMLIMYLRQVWRIQVARDGMKTTLAVWSLVILIVTAWRWLR